MAIEGAFDKQDLNFEKKGGNNVVQNEFSEAEYYDFDQSP